MAQYSTRSRAAASDSQVSRPNYREEDISSRQESTALHHEESDAAEDRDYSSAPLQEKFDEAAEEFATRADEGTTIAVQQDRAARGPKVEVSQNQEDLVKALTAALGGLAAPTANDSSAAKGPEARVPDRFDGSRADKLRPFLSQLNIVFLNHPKRFSTDRAKVLFAGSFLSGVAADWFEPFIDDTNSGEATVLDSWILFKDRLTKVFGDPNATATAEHNLSMLEMRDSESIAEYITRFRTEAARLDWDDAALRYRFRVGLCDRLLDDLSKMAEQPTTLTSLMETALLLDNRHWERNRERRLRRKSHPTPAAPMNQVYRRTTLPLSPVKQVAFRPARTFRPPRPQNKPAGLLDKVLVNGHLTADEKKRRAEKGLCSYCAGPHQIDSCPSKPKSNNAPAGRAARTAFPKN